ISLLVGCDAPILSPTVGEYDYLPDLQAMKRISVRFSANTLHHSFIKQGELDPGVTSDIWLPREQIYQNADSLYTIEWKDSVFQTNACFLYRQIDPIFGISYGCSENSYIRGIYHSGSRSVSNLICFFQRCDNCQDPDNYKAER